MPKLMYISFLSLSKKKKSKDKKRKREEDEETQLDIVGEPLQLLTVWKIGVYCGSCPILSVVLISTDGACQSLHLESSLDVTVVALLIFLFKMFFFF